MNDERPGPGCRHGAVHRRKQPKDGPVRALLLWVSLGCVPAMSAGACPGAQHFGVSKVVSPVSPHCVSVTGNQLICGTPYFATPAFKVENHCSTRVWLVTTWTTPYQDQAIVVEAGGQGSLLPCLLLAGSSTLLDEGASCTAQVLVGFGDDPPKVSAEDRYSANPEDASGDADSRGDPDSLPPPAPEPDPPGVTRFSVRYEFIPAGSGCEAGPCERSWSELSRGEQSRDPGLQAEAAEAEEPGTSGCSVASPTAAGQRNSALVGLAWAATLAVLWLRPVRPTQARQNREAAGVRGPSE